MDARSLRDKFATKEANLINSEFMAPFTEGVQKALIKVDKVVYPFRIVGQKGTGFGIFKPRDGNCACFVRDAEFDQVRAYLNILPQIHLVLAYETDKGWVAYPMNAESADKSLGLESEVVVKSVTDCERFDTIVARYDTVNFWFDEMFLGGDPAKANEMRQCFRKDHTPQQMKKALARIKGLTPEDHKTFDLAVKSWQKFQVLSTEDRIKKVLRESGAMLGSYVVRGDHLEVRWKTDRGTAYTSMVKKDTLDVVSAGICLDDGSGPQDSQFNLRDLPYIMRQGEDRREIVRLGVAWEQNFQNEHVRDLEWEDDN